MAGGALVGAVDTGEVFYLSFFGQFVEALAVAGSAGFEGGNGKGSLSPPSLSRQSLGGSGGLPHHCTVVENMYSGSYHLP